MSGLTLIETLVYLALLSLLLTGCLVSAYALQETAARNQTMARIEQDGVFLLLRLATLPETEEVDASSLTSYELTSFSLIRAGGSALDPERIEVSFTLHAPGGDSSLQRTFRNTFYMDAL